MSTSYDTSVRLKPLRVAFLDFPMGYTVGRPNEPELQREIIKAALSLVETISEPGTIVRLPYDFEEGGTRKWEKEIRDLVAQEQSLATIRGQIAKAELGIAARSE